MKTGFSFSAVLVILIGLAGCAGYRIGNQKPEQLAGISRIAVPMATNDTLHPRAETFATSAVADAMAQDGTYRLSTLDQADAVLELRVSHLDYNTIRGSRVDTLLPIELANKVTINWSLRDASDPTRVLAAGSSSGRSQLFVSSNLQTARNNALTESVERAAKQLVARISNGF